MKKGLSGISFVLLCLQFWVSSFAQDAYDASSPRTYYYNNLEAATAGTANTYFSAGASTSTSSAISVTSSSSLNASKSFTTTGNSTVGYIKWNFLSNSTTGTNTSLNSNAWEWEFDYKNVTGAATGDADNNGNMSANSWRYWLIADSYATSSTTLGLYVTQYNGNLVVKYKYGTATNQSQTYATISMPNNTNTYQIRFVRSITGFWNIYVLNRTTNTTVTSLSVNMNVGALSTYNFSYLETTTTTANRFQWDNFNFYQVKLEYIPISGSENGITTSVYPGIVDAIPYGVSVNVRGDVPIGRFVINFSANGQALFESGELYKITTLPLSKTGATKLGDFLINSSNTNQLDLSPEYYYGASTDGTTVFQTRYFLVAKGRSSFYNGYPTSITYSVSTSAGDNYTGFFQNSPPYGPSSPSSSSPPSVSGDVWDWQGTSTSWTASGSWKCNTVATTSSPSASTDIVRFAVANTYTTDPRLTASTSFGSLVIGNLRSVTFKLYPSSGSSVPTLTLNTGLILNSGASLTFNGNDATDGGSFSSTNASSGRYPQVTLGNSSVSTMASTSKLDLVWTKVVLSSGGSFTLSSTSSGTAAIGALTDGVSQLTGTNYTVERYFTGGAASNRGWRLMSSPVNNSTNVPVTAASTYNFSSLKNNLLITGTGGTSNGFDAPSGYTANGPTILFYNTPTSTFTALSSITAINRSVGSGFYFYFRGNRTTNTLNKLVRTSGFAVPETNVTGTQTGTLNQGAFNYTLSNAGSGFNLVGNPYPSTIRLITSALTNVTPFVYLFTPGGNSTTAQAVGATQTGSTSIASGQGFFVKTASSGANFAVSFSENLKYNAQVTGSGLLMSTPKADIVATTRLDGGSIAATTTNTLSLNSDPIIIGLKMIQDSANYDVATLRYHDSYVKNYNEMEDADDLNGNGQTVFLGAMTADKRQVAIASQPLEKQLTSVYLTVNDNTSGTYAIKRTDLSALPDIYNVWLFDHYKKDSIDLRANDTYNFNLDKNVTSTFGSDRFEVVIRRIPLLPYQLTAFSGKKDNNKNKLRWSTTNEYSYTSFEIERSSDNVNFISLSTIKSSGKGNYDFEDQSFSSVVHYRLKQIDVDNKVTYSSVITISPPNNFSIYPNPVENFIKFDFTEYTQGGIILRIYNSMGNLVLNSSFTAANGQQNVSNLTQGGYAIEVIDTKTKRQIVSGKFVKL